jgi:hypothetical protein
VTGGEVTLAGGEGAPAGGEGAPAGGEGAPAEGVPLGTVVESGLGLLAGGLEVSDGLGLLAGGLEVSDGLGLFGGPEVPPGFGLSELLGLTTGVGVTDETGLAEGLAQAAGAGLAQGLADAAGAWQGVGVGCRCPGVPLAAPGPVTPGDGCCPYPSTVPPPRPPFPPVWREWAPVPVPESVCHPNGVTAKMPIATTRAATTRAAAAARCARAHRAAGISPQTFPVAPGGPCTHMMKLCQPPSANRAAAE